MNMYPKINYIGNKEKIAEWIVQNLPIKTGTILDLFSGGCSVSYKMKQSGFQVLSNDVLYSNFCLSKSFIENKNDKLYFTPKADELKQFYSKTKYSEIKWLVEKLYFEHEVKELVCLINYATTLQEYQNFIFLSLLRRSMIRKIPYSRMNIKWSEIVRLRNEELSYEKYGRRRAYHNITFLEHIYQNLNQYNNAIFDNGKQNLSFNLDCINMIENLGEVDLIYIDPPYPSTMNNYHKFYGEFDIMLKKNIEKYTDFTNKDMFLSNLKLIFQLAKNKTKCIVISINNNSKPNCDDVIEQVKGLVAETSILNTTHLYKVTGKENKNKTSEILLIFKLK